jgi:hypothetical protein
MGDSKPQFSWQPRGQLSGAILDRGQKIVEFSDGRLRNGILKRGGRRIIENDVGLRMFWMQYADHQKPGRSADIVKRIETDQTDPERFLLGVVSTNADQSIESRFSLTLSYREDLNSYYYHFRALLTVQPGKTWVVTHNPLNGELEYCNFYPDGVFRQNKLWQVCCYEAEDGQVVRVPHHHLPTSDKILKPFKKSGRLLYLLDDENPVVELLGNTPVNTAAGLLYTMPGLCAYMFDVHLAYRVCNSSEPVSLTEGQTFTADFALSEVGWEKGKKILSQSVYTEPPEVNELPIFIEGTNTFSKTVDDVTGDFLPVWSWSMEYGDGWDSPSTGQLEIIDYRLDRSIGHSDSCSLRIKAGKKCVARWSYTALGEPFFQKPFSHGKSYRLTAYVRTENVQGSGATIGIRLHRQDEENPESVFDSRKYERYYARALKGTNEWTRLEITTPRIDSKPDRVHLLLEQSGEGTTWFDDVEYNEVD